MNGALTFIACLAALLGWVCCIGGGALVEEGGESKGTGGYAALLGAILIFTAMVIAYMAGASR